MAENKIRGFRNVGTNLFKILTTIAANKELCRLLKFSSPDVYNQPLPTDDECFELIGKNILFAPKVPDTETVEGSFVVVLFESFDLNETNNEFLLSTITFDVLCPLDHWQLNGESLRPFLMMAEINDMFNKKRLNSIGTLQLALVERFTLSTDMAGYTMHFEINEFN